MHLGHVQGLSRRKVSNSKVSAQQGCFINGRQAWLGHWTRMSDILERNKEDKKLNREFSSIPWPDNKYLRRIRNKKDQTKSEADDKSSKERMHSFTV